MPHSTLNPAELHDPIPMGYSHTAAVPAGAELVLVAGQYASTVDGSVVSTDFAAQVRQTFANVGVALAAHGLDLSHVVQLYLDLGGVIRHNHHDVVEALGSRITAQHRKKILRNRPRTSADRPG